MAQFLYFKIQRMRHHQVTAGNQTSHVVHRSPCLVYFLALVFKRLNVDHSVHTAMSPKKTHQIPQHNNLLETLSSQATLGKMLIKKWIENGCMCLWPFLAHPCCHCCGDFRLLKVSIKTCCSVKPKLAELIICSLFTDQLMLLSQSTLY